MVKCHLVCNWRQRRHVCSEVSMKGNASPQTFCKLVNHRRPFQSHVQRGRLRSPREDPSARVSDSLDSGGLGPEAHENDPRKDKRCPLCTAGKVLEM